MEGEATSPSVVAVKQRSRWQRVAGWTAIGAAVLLAALALLIVGLNTGPGRGLIARQVSGMTFANGLRIAIGRIDGSLYGIATLHEVKVYDTRGLFLSAPQIELDWRPFAYLHNHVDVRSAHAGLVELERVPALKPSTVNGPLLPDLTIDIGRLTVDQLVAKPAVSGERRVLRLDGRAHIADRRAQVKLAVQTIAAPGGQGGDRLDLDLDAVPEANRLVLKAQLDAPKGGVIGALAGLKDRLALRLDGGGDWTRWDGTLVADLGQGQLARLALTERSGTFKVQGTTHLQQVLTGTAASIAGTTTDIDLSAALDRRRATLSGRVASDAVTAVPNGVIDFGTDRFDGLAIVADVVRPDALAPGLAGRGVRLWANLDGAFARPQVQYRLSAATLAIRDIVLEGLTASGKAQVTADHVAVPIAAKVTRITGLDSAAGGPLRNVSLSGDLAIQGPRILSDNLRIRADRIDGKAVVVADLSRGFYTGGLTGRVSSYRIDSVGVLALETRADLKQAGQGMSLTGSVHVRSQQLFNASVRDFLGGNAVGSGNFSYGPDGIVRFSGLRLSAPLLRVVDGHGSYTPNGQMAVSATGHSTRYGPLALELTGTPANPRAIVLARSPGLGLGLADLRAQIIGTNGSYRLLATGQTDYGPLSADVTMAQGKGPTAFEINHGDLAGIGFTGRMQATPAGPYVGQLAASGRGLVGTVQLGAAGRYQEAVFHLRASDTVLPGSAQLSIGSAIADGRVVLYEKPYVVADVQLAQTRLRGFDVAAARALVDYRDGKGQAKFVVEATSAVPFRVAGNAQLAPDLWRVALDGRVRGIGFMTSSPARIVPGKSGYTLLPTRINFGQGNVRLAGEYGSALAVQSRMDALDIALLNAFLPGYGLGGKATGSLDFTQASPDAFPRADARLSIDGFTRTTAVSVSQPVDVNFVGQLMADGGEGRAVIRQRGAVIGRMIASLRPLGPGAGGWIDRVLAAPLGGGIRFNGPAETLWSFTGQNDQSLSGQAAIGADFSGHLQDPQLTGIVRGNGLTYENQTYGTRFTGMTVSGRFVGDRLQIDQLSAVAGQGRISGSGSISLASASGYPMDVSFDLDNARLARSNALSSAATGKLRLTKVAGQTALLSGTLSLPETRYELARQGAAQVQDLTGVRFKPQPGRVRVTGNEPALPSTGVFAGLRLDIGLDADNQLFVTGMGLDSEWSARLRVTGTNTAPRMTGDVNLVRGTLSFAGRQFALQEGRLIFTGGETADPQVTLNASETIDAVAVTVNVTGRAFNPQISFTADPALPPDEVLSRILFGNSVGQLSPLQAVQLAASLNSLRGSGGGLNPLGKLRAATGASRLSILAPDTATGRGTAVAAGRYISNNVYVELITDARGFTATQIEVGLSPTLSILSQAGGTGLNTFNLRYRKRY